MPGSKAQVVSRQTMSQRRLKNKVGFVKTVDKLVDTSDDIPDFFPEGIVDRHTLPRGQPARQHTIAADGKIPDRRRARPSLSGPRQHADEDAARATGRLSRGAPAASAGTRPRDNGPVAEPSPRLLWPVTRGGDCRSPTMRSAGPALSLFVVGRRSQPVPAKAGSRQIHRVARAGARFSRPLRVCRRSNEPRVGALRLSRLASAPRVNSKTDASCLAR